nr:FecR family protein [Pontibacterium sinense]
MVNNVYAKTSVGQIIFAVGKATLDRGSVTTDVTRGDTIFEGDAFSTGPDGHVHLLMHDKGFFSLRPNSRMRIERYSYDSANLSQNRVKIQLETGVLRSITGRAGEMNKRQYRLNTPVAAIGVRGTDYSVYASEALSRISVRSGGVVMSPFGDGCQVAGSGPCDGVAAAELLAVDLGAVLETRVGESTVIKYDTLSPDDLNPPLPEERHLLRQVGDNLSSQETKHDNKAPASTLDNPDESSEKVEGEGKAEVSNESPTEQEARAGLSGGGTHYPNDEQIDFDGRREELSAYVSERPLVQLVVEAGLKGDGLPLPKDAGLVEKPSIIWGRWAEYSGDDESYKTIARLLYENRRYAALNSVFGMLEERVDDRDIPSTGRTFFRLNGYEAYVKRSDRLEGAVLSNASLLIDFEQARFATHVNFDAESLSETSSIVGSGDVRSTGFFSSDSGAPAVINGVFSPGAGEAGYLFQYNLAPGVDAVGATHWVNTSVDISR